MPHKIGFVDQSGRFPLAHHNLIKEIRDFCCGYGTVSSEGYAGTGAGALYDVRSLPAGPTESWTVTATSSTSFTVTGSVSGAQAAATVGVPYDNGKVAFTITKGGGAAHFDGINSAMNFALGAFGTGDYTVEFWVYRDQALPVNGSSMVLFDSRPAATSNSVLLSIVGTFDATNNHKIGFYHNGSYRAYSTTLVQLNTWYHVALVRSGGVTRLYVNGVQEGVSYTDTSNYGASQAYVASSYTGIGFFGGLIDDLRVTSGVARYTANFTPPAEPFPDGAADPQWASVTVALHMDGPHGSPIITDGKALPVTVTGGTYIDRLISKYPGAPYIAGDAFTFNVTRSAVAIAGVYYTVLRYDELGSKHEVIMLAPGLSGTEEIYLGFRSYHDVTADVYNILVGVFTGYTAAVGFELQPGASYAGVPTHNQRIDYWMTFNGQRIAMGLKVGTPVYENLYAGKFLPYATPSAYPYPVGCLGALVGESVTRFSETTHDFYLRGSSDRARVRGPGGWEQGKFWPWGNAFLTGNSSAINNSALRDVEGQYPLMPVEVYTNNGMLGQLDGVYHVSGFDNVVENTVTVGADTYVVMQSVGRTGHTDYYALRLDN